MRAKTSKGDFMAVAYPGSGGGAAKIGVLGRVVPRYIFKVVCMSENKEAVLMRDHPGLFNYKVSVKEMETATKDYVWMQMGTIGRTSELVEGGLMDLRSEVLLRKLDNLEQSPMFREMASRQAYKKSVRWYLGTKRRIRNGVTELMGCGIPETVLGGQGCRKGEGGEHYLFHRWFEGFVGCALAAVDEWILREGVFLKMWSCFGETEKMVRWRAIGKCVHWLSLLVMRLEYAQHSEAESAEREWWVTQAGSALVKMKDRFIETSHRW
ncbi:unnamed protein product [Chondrus crispus]|uniref:Uncharacterized protein n=1 Tax=Chondrus crispus TaxID=2769 RepID=R7QLC2_CHOCR|nr:unnamed protein product [Chondrus crispus]CDF38195.1 unnamed protein product [Chondrus crispus]|eukprot:XP_005718064.1 unnamed protein product [Chondrus crispus]